MQNISNNSFDVCECGFLKDFKSWNIEWAIMCIEEENKGGHAFDTQKDIIQKVRSSYISNNEIVNHISFFRIIKIPFPSLSYYFSEIDSLKRASGFPCLKLICGK